MKIRLTTILTLLTSLTFGQQSVTDDILQIVRTAIADKKLPKELINNVDSLHAVLTKKEYKPTETHYPLTVGVEGTNDNGLKHSQHIKWDDKEIWIWGIEEFFMFDMYWLTPSNTKTKDNKISFDFVTHTWYDKKVKYYKGTVKAEKTQDKWTVSVTKFSETKNNFSEWYRTRPKHEIKAK
jgi:hypothetical protein